jgi:hypothetical protein
MVEFPGESSRRIIRRGASGIRELNMSYGSSSASTTAKSSVLLSMCSAHRVRQPSAIADRAPRDL